MTMGRSGSTIKHQRAVGVFPNRRVAEQALHELRDSGFPMERVSVITQDRVRDDGIAGAEVKDSVHNSRRIGNKADEGAAIGAATGGTLGGLTGLLVGLGTLAIPGVGPVILAGAAATALATTLAGGAIGAAAGGLLGALVGLGIPEERARVYHDRVAQGDYLVIVDGTDEQIALAERILHHRGIEDYGVYAAPAAHPHTMAYTTTRATTPVHYQSNVSQSNISKEHDKHAIGIFSNQQDAEYAVADLRNAGFPLNQVVLIARHFDRRESFAGADLHDHFDAARYGIPVDRAQYYNDRLDRGDYLVVVNGTEDEVRQAAALLNRRGLQDWQLYTPNTPDRSTVVDTAHTTQTVLPVEVVRPVEAARPLDAVATGVTSTPAISTSAIPSNRQAVAVFANRQDAETAINQLRKAGFSLNHTALIARHLDQRESFAGVELYDRFDATKYGISGDWTRYYNDRLDRGDYLVVVTGAEADIRQAEMALNSYRIRNWETYTSSGTNDRHSNHSRDYSNRR